jgi:hypothetical protein
MIEVSNYGELIFSIILLFPTSLLRDSQMNEWLDTQMRGGKRDRRTGEGSVA